LSIQASLWKGRVRPTLASGSATRRLLLESAGIPVNVEPPYVDERGLEDALLASGGAPSAVAVELARAKALAVSLRRPSVYCFGADQTLLFDGRLAHKAANIEEAAQNLLRLSGKTHELVAGVCVARDGVAEFTASQRARLTMRALDEGAVRRYLEAAGPAVLSSVGAYQIEGLGIHLFETIEGDHSTILGLPLMPLMQWLRGQGLLAL
jgi:septum formation protein